MVLKEILLIFAAAAVINLAATTNPSANYDWWESAVFYQIYPRSFKDITNDGIGDLPGIITKLPYLKDTGITAILLSTIFKSPQVDQGYDISDYYSLDPDYGTLDDFKELIRKAKALGIKVILDFVPNHTSNEHEWFKKSIARDGEYEDFYVWHNGVMRASGITPPNNWVSNFGGSAWEWNDERKQYYLHQFDRAQPDLNYRNPLVKEAMKKVLIYWLNVGVDGFRIVGVNFLCEDELFANEPTAIGGWPEDDFRSLQHIYTVDQNQTYETLYRWRELIDQYVIENGGDARILITEAYTTLENTFLYYGSSDGSSLGAHFSFNFDFIYYLNNNTSAEDVKSIIDNWLTLLPKMYFPNWMLGNHDHHRLGSRVGKERIDGFNMLVSILPGIQVTYYGEEIGMLDGEVTCEEGRDPRAIKNCSTYNEFSRDFERTPFHWDNSLNAGFNQGHKTWLPVSDLYLPNNLAYQENTDILSHYLIYKTVLKLRPLFTMETTLETFVVGENVLEVIRTNNCSSKLGNNIAEVVLLFNLNHIEETVDIVGGGSEELTVHIPSVTSKHSAGRKISRKNIKLAAGEGLILSSYCPINK